MDTLTLVDNQIDAGRSLVENLVQGGFEVTAAFWLKPSWNGKWYFYIATPIEEAAGRGEAYMRLHPFAHAMPQPYVIRPVTIKVIGANDPITQDVLKAHALMHRAGIIPGQYAGRVLGDIILDEAYLYPLPIPAAS